MSRYLPFFAKQREHTTPEVWINRFGEPVIIKNMDDGYLLNTINLLLRHADKMRGVAELELAMSWPRDASDHVEDGLRWEANCLEATTRHQILSREMPAWKGLIAEAERRHLFTILPDGYLPKHSREEILRSTGGFA